MANSICFGLKNCRVLFTTVATFNRFSLKAVATPVIYRNLYANATLGIDSYKEQRERTKQQMANITGRFKEKMSEYVSEDSKNMVFTEDLKNMIHIAESDGDLELVVKMLKKYNQQNSSLRFGNYVFGPVVMRLFYVLNKPDLALDCFKAPELQGLFDQLMAYQILMDLLYENKKYNEILEVSDIIKDRQLEATRYPKNVVVLTLAACYKLNSQESLDYVLNFWKELKAVGHQPMRRAVTFSAGLALNQGKPDVALEMLTHSRNQSYTTVRNLKVLALAEVNRFEDVLPILKSVLAEDMPVTTGTPHTFNRDVIDKVKKLAESHANEEVLSELNRIEQQLKKEERIVDTTLNEQLCVEIQTPPDLSNRRSNNQRFQRDQRYQRDNRGFQQRDSRGFQQRESRRPGLQELV